MSMKLASSFTVPAAADKVIALFLDPATMQSCIPGCEELVQTDDTHYKGSLVNEVAHVRFKAGFTAEIVSVTESHATEPAVVKAVLRGEDRRLGSTIRMDATLTVTPLPAGAEGGGDGSDVAYEFELAIRGKLGRLGEAVIRRRTAEVERQFTEALTAVCAGRPVPAGGGPAAGKTSRAATPAALEAAEQATQVATSVPVLAGAPRPAGSPDAAVEGGPARRDWLVIGLAAAASFGYGVLLGQRLASRR
jgi:carbon monoxide dehydrogenase subunit G